MEPQEATESVEHSHGTPFKSKAALQISVLALILAIANLGGSNSTKSASEHDLASANLFSFYQAKNVRQTQYKIALDQLELQLTGLPNVPSSAREKIEGKMRHTRKISSGMNLSLKPGMEKKVTRKGQA